jgi:hypothetical protein
MAKDAIAFKPQGFLGSLVKEPAATPIEKATWYRAEGSGTAFCTHSQRALWKISII